ncbi:MAG: MutS2/Smr-associated SH3 domain-containing protein, partial [Bacteroidota bacterium]
VKDNASPELADIRKNIKIKHAKVRRSLESIYKSAVKEGFVPEGSTITVRDGRMVVPLNAEHKRRIRGFVHDESSTGQTVFLEPAEVLDGNNEIRELEYAEKREVVKILMQLTDSIRRNREPLSKAYQFLGIIDFIRAKAKLAMELESSLPKLKDNPKLLWDDARHPILFLSHQKLDKKVVPLNIELSDEQRILIISGPNAGGKSVCLKTVGLIQYMLQCGLLPPVGESSEFGIFKDMFIDIGDEQSIENDLSTYSSHLTNMKHFLKKSGANSLALIDEFGTGTDPQFGGAIAEAVLDKLFEKGGYGVITTHYSNIKHYAENKSGMINGAMKFDMVNLEPLYELEMGKPGSSFSLEIARKIGLSHHVIDYAKEAIGEKSIDVDDLLLKLEKQKQQIRDRDIKLKNRENEVKQLGQKYTALLTQLEENKKKIIDSAKQEAQSLLKDTNRQIEKTIRHIQENKAHKKETKKARERLNQLKEKVEVPKKPVKQTVEVIGGEINVGDSVRIIGQEVAGKVLQLKGKGAEVQMGELKSTIKISRLEKISNTKLKEINKKTTGVSKGMNLNQK